MCVFVGLPQDHQTSYGSGNNQKATGNKLLLQWQGMYTGFQHNVHKLLHLQQIWRGKKSLEERMFWNS